MSACKNPSSAACLKFNPRPGMNFCQACGASASSIGVVTQLATQVGTPTPGSPSRPQVSNSSQQTQAGAPGKLLSVSKPKLNQQALKNGLMASLQAQRAQRLPATISTGLMAASGVLLGFGLALVVINILDSGDSPNSALAFFAGVFCIFLAWSVANWLPDSFKTAGVAAANVLVPVTAIATMTGQLAEGNLGLVLLFAAFLSGVIWVLPGTAGRPSIQALGIGYAAFAFIAFSVQSRIYGYINDLSNFEFRDPLSFAEALVRDSGTLVLVIGALLIGAGHQLDRKLWSNVATPFIAVGILLVLGGAWSLQLSSGLDSGDSDSTGTAIVLVAVAVGITYVGGFASRRFTLGLGTWLITGGLVALVVFLSADDPSIMSVAILMLIVSAIVAFAVFKLEPKIAQIASKNP